VIGVSKKLMLPVPEPDAHGDDDEQTCRLHRSTQNIEPGGFLHSPKIDPRQDRDEDDDNDEGRACILGVDSHQTEKIPGKGAGLRGHGSQP
jgi:hypothetical protein